MISKNVVILTTEELAEIKRKAFLRGVERGKFEAHSTPQGLEGHSGAMAEPTEVHNLLEAAAWLRKVKVRCTECGREHHFPDFDVLANMIEESELKQRAGNLPRLGH